jgi:transposase
MRRPRFRDARWERIYAVPRAYRGIDVGREPATRRFVEAVLWMARAGGAWRLGPGAVGSWDSVDQRCARWQEKGVWQALLDHLAADADLEWVMLDSTVVRAHACAAGAKKAPAIKRSAARAAASPASCTLPATAWATRWPSV